MRWKGFEKKKNVKFYSRGGEHGGHGEECVVVSRRGRAGGCPWYITNAPLSDLRLTEPVLCPLSSLLAVSWTRRPVGVEVVMPVILLLFQSEWRSRADQTDHAVLVLPLRLRHHLRVWQGRDIQVFPRPQVRQSAGGWRSPPQAGLRGDGGGQDSAGRQQQDGGHLRQEVTLYTLDDEGKYFDFFN